LIGKTISKDVFGDKIPKCDSCDRKKATGRDSGIVNISILYEAFGLKIPAESNRGIKL